MCARTDTQSTNTTKQTYTDRRTRHAYRNTPLSHRGRSNQHPGMTEKETAAESCVHALERDESKRDEFHVRFVLVPRRWSQKCDKCRRTVLGAYVDADEGSRCVDGRSVGRRVASS